MKSRAHERLGRFAASALLPGALLAATGCGSTVRQIDIFKGGPVQVSLREVVEGGHPRAQGYAHPATLTPEQVKGILASVGFEEYAYFSWHDEGPLFSEDEITQLAPKIAEGLQKATADQWVSFSARGTRTELVFSAKSLSDGICFVKDGKFNLVLGNIGFVQTVDTEPSRMDPRDLKTPEHVRLTAKRFGPGVSPPPVVPGDRWLGKERRNWLVFDLASEHPQGVAAPALSGPEPTTSPDPAERLRRLKDLRDQGLITPAEYEKKRQEILKDL